MRIGAKAALPPGLSVHLFFLQVLSRGTPDLILRFKIGHGFVHLAVLRSLHLHNDDEGR
jgi:hypothetical protein